MSQELMDAATALRANVAAISAAQQRKEELEAEIALTAERITTLQQAQQGLKWTLEEAALRDAAPDPALPAPPKLEPKDLL